MRPQQGNRDAVSEGAGAPDTDGPGETDGTGPVVRLRLPPAPPALSPNARTHWSQRCEVVAAYRMIAKARATAAIRGAEEDREPAWPLTFAMTVTMVTKNNRRRDLDNLLASCKPLIDGLVDAGLLVDDSSRYLTAITVQRRVEPGAEPGVEVDLYAAEEA